AALLDALAKAPGVLRAEAWRTDVAITSTETREKALRTKGDAYPAMALLIDGSSAEALHAALEQEVPEPMRRAANVDVMRLVLPAAGTGAESCPGATSAFSAPLP